jgi:prepilin-type N-terminal cleavage/methylation domain-containing protein
MCSGRRTKQQGSRGFSLIEICVTVAVIGIFLTLAYVNVFSLLKKYGFKEDVHDFVSTLRMAIAAASQSDRRYEVIVDLVEQTYLLCEITTSDLDSYSEEDIIDEGRFGKNCRVEYVQFDDGDTFSDNVLAKFRAGRAGWLYGAKIVFQDNDERKFTVVVNRLNRVIEVLDGDVEIWTTKAKDDLFF